MLSAGKQRLDWSVLCLCAFHVKTLLNATICSDFVGPACTADAKGATVGILQHETKDEMKQYFQAVFPPEDPEFKVSFTRLFL